MANFKKIRLLTAVLLFLLCQFGVALSPMIPRAHASDPVFAGDLVYSKGGGGTSVKFIESLDLNNPDSPTVLQSNFQAPNYFAPIVNHSKTKIYYSVLVTGSPTVSISPGSMAQTLVAQNCRGATVSPNDNLLACGHRVIDLTTGQETIVNPGVPSIDIVDWLSDSTVMMRLPNSACSDGSSYLAKVNIDGSGFAPITPLSCNTRNTIGRASADGTMVVYSNDAGLWLVNADGSNPRLIMASTQQAAPIRPALSRDNKYIAVPVFNLGTPNQNSKIMVINAQTGNVEKTLLQPADGAYREVDWIGTYTPSDSAAPFVDGVPDRPANEAGWYGDDVSITWIATDPEPSSGTPSTPAATLATQEGTHIYTSEPSCDPVGNCATGALELSIDKTAPWAGFQSWTVNPKSTFQSASLSVIAADTLSGVVGGEYFMGDTDPGQGNGLAMSWNGTELGATFGTDLQPGVYKVSVRAQDAAGNWSPLTVDYLVVYNTLGARVTGHHSVQPSYDSGNGDLLPGLTDEPRAYKATFGFNVSYDSQGAISGNSDMAFDYATDNNCSSPQHAPDCHTLSLDASSIDWLVVNGQVIFQGVAVVVVDDVATSNPFRVIAEEDGTNGQFTLLIYAPEANPNSASPLYHVSREVSAGKIQIH